MDEIDIQILQHLKLNSRATASEISKRVSLSLPAVAERIRKLEQNEIIQQYTVRINRSKIAQDLLAFIFVSVEGTEHIPSFRSGVLRLPGVLECHHIAGPQDYLLKVVVKDTASLELFLTQSLKQLPGVAATNTIISLSTLKEEINS